MTKKILFDKETIESKKTELVVLKDELNPIVDKVILSMEQIPNNWKGKKASEKLKTLEIRKTDLKNKVINTLNENITYLDGVIQTMMKTETTEVEAIKEESKPDTFIVPPPTDIQEEVYIVPPFVENVEKRSNGYVHLDSNVEKQLGLRRNNKTGEFIKRGGSYYGIMNGLKYLIHIPTDSDGNVPKNLPIILQFHGAGGLTKRSNILNWSSNGTMGLEQSYNNPNTQAIIIMPQVDDYNRGNKKIVNNIQQSVISSLEADKDSIALLGFSYGGKRPLTYAMEYPDGIKFAIAIDGMQTESEVRAMIDKNIPTLLVNSNVRATGVQEKYNERNDILMKNFPSSQNMTYYKTDPSLTSKIMHMMESTYQTKGLSTIYIEKTGHVEVKDLTVNSKFFETMLRLLNSK